MKEFYENQHILNLQAYYIPTYLDFSHADLENADFSQSKKTHMPRTCCNVIHSRRKIQKGTATEKIIITLGGFVTQVNEMTVNSILYNLAIVTILGLTHLAVNVLLLF